MSLLMYWLFVLGGRDILCEKFDDTRGAKKYFKAIMQNLHLYRKQN